MSRTDRKRLPTLRDIIQLAEGASDEQLDAPIEVAVRTWTRAHADYPEAFSAELNGGQLRIYAAFPEGISIHKRNGSTR